MLVEYVGLLAMVAASLLFCLLWLGTAAWIRARSPRRSRRAHGRHGGDTGIDSGDSGDFGDHSRSGAAADAPPLPDDLVARPRAHFGVGFYSLSILFLLLNVASLYFHAWGAGFREAGTQGLVAMSFFALCLSVAWFYSRARGVF